MIQQNRIPDNPLKYLTESLLFSGLSQAASDVYLFKCNLENGYTVWSENAVKYFGFPRQYEEHFTEVWMAHVHPEEREDYQKDIAEIFDGKKDHHYFQYRSLNAAGEYVWLECDGKVITDEESGSRFFVGLINRLDITGKFDPVTNCINIKEFYLTDYTGDAVLLLVGIDRFRHVINQIGFSRSNKILAELGAVLQKNSSKNSVYRMTGDEFVVLLPGTDMSAAARFFQSVQTEFQKKLSETHRSMNITFSGGAICYSPLKDDKEMVIQRLEHCLEYSKQQGLALLTEYSSVVDERRVYTLKLQKALSEAIAHDFEGFRLVYQPVVTSKTQKIDGAEALLRFYSEELGLVSPGDFIPLLEANGDIIPVGKWVAETAIRQKAEWDKCSSGLRVGFNVSLLQLRDQSLTRYIVKLIRQYGIRPDEIIVELTETKKIGDPDGMREALAPLVEAGVWIFLDDFGMEASNFTLVKELKISGIKIDHSFVSKMEIGENDHETKVNIAIISSITYLARSLGLRVIVEGVENGRIDEVIHDMGIHYTQGYYYARPLPPQVLAREWIVETDPHKTESTDLSVGHSHPGITVAELDILMRQLAKIYDIVRIVDVGKMRVLTYGENGVRQVTKQSCYEVWGNSERCKNCVSAMAFREKNRMTKFEFIDHEVYHVTSQYIVVNGEACMLEIVEKNADKTLFGSFGQNRFVDTMKAYAANIYTDSLTKISNRKYLDEQLLSLEMDAVAMIDIDNFKEINDTYGHLCGDKVLHDVAQEIRRNVRSEDCVVRYGGDEFLITFAVMKAGCLRERLEEIRTAIERRIFSTRKDLKVTISIGGICVHKRNYVSELLPLSDRALYQAKKQRNLVEIIETEEV